MTGGFIPGETVEVRLDGTVLLATLTANAYGGVNTWLTIPASTSLGGHILSVEGQTSGLVLEAGITVTSPGPTFPFPFPFSAQEAAANPALTPANPVKQPQPAVQPMKPVHPAIAAMKPVHPAVAAMKPVHPAVAPMKPTEVKAAPMAHQAESNSMGTNGPSTALLGAAGLASLSLGSLIVLRRRRSNAK